MAKPETKQLLTVKQVAELTGWSQSTVRQKVWRRQLPYVKLGGSIRFEHDVILSLIDKGRVDVLPVPPIFKKRGAANESCEAQKDEEPSPTEERGHNV